MKNTLVLPGSAGTNVVNVGNCAEQAARYLASTGSFFRKGKHVVRLVDVRLEIITLPMAQTLLFEMMDVRKWTGRGEASELVPASEIKDSTLQAILGGHYVAIHIPQVTVVAQCSFLVLSDGRLIPLKKGYNPERGGILVIGGDVPPDVPVHDAVAAIRGLFADFSFATVADRSRAIAAVFNAALRMAGIYERHPLLAVEADDSQAGKTLLWAMVCAIFGQRYGTVAQKRGGVGSLDESIMEKLVAGNGFLLLDNLRGKVDSPFLEACLTLEGGSIDARVAGIRSIPVDPRLVVFALTSNGVELTVDLANRTLMIRIRKQASQYAFQAWKDSAGNEVSIRQHIESRQAYYHGCVNSILRDWWSSGAKRLPCTEHSFRDSIGALDFIVQNYFKLPPLLDGHQVALERTTKPGLGWLRVIALKAADHWCVVSWTASRIAERCLQDGIAIPGVSVEVDSTIAAQQVGIAMASAFGSAALITIDGVEVTRSLERDSEGRERKVYTFRQALS